MSQPELMDLCLRMAKFKKDNKELLTYLLFEAHNEMDYIEKVKLEMDVLFEDINTNSFFYMKKTIRKILRVTKKRIQHSKKKETEVELLLHFCSRLKDLRPSIKGNTVLYNLYKRTLESVKKTVSTLHEDLQYDFTEEIKEIIQR